MHTENSTGRNNKPANAFETVGRVMVEFRDEMDAYNVIGTRIAARTALIIRTVFGTLFLSSIYIVFLIYKMSMNMSVMTGHLENMYGQFGTMADDMHDITLKVDSMDRSVSGMPEIAMAMTAMHAHIGAMNDSVDGMNGSMTSIDNDMYLVDSNMREMNGRMAGVNGAVNSMSRDVFQMSKPVHSGPMSGFWPH